MILTIITNSKNKVIAISEDTGIANAFYDQLNMTHPQYTISVITKKSECNRLLILYSELYLDEYEDGIVIRDCDMTEFNTMVTDYIDDIGDACKTLVRALDDMKISDKKRKEIIKALMSLWRNIPHIDMSILIRDFYKTKRNDF
jgi:hypothetical protein